MSPKALARTALVLGMLAPTAGPAAVVTEVYTNRGAFEARLGLVREVNFDDVEADTIDPAPFAADRYAATSGIVITGEDGQYASQGFGFPEDFPPSSAPNEYAPGPIENLLGGGNQTSVTFVAGGQPAAVAGFGAVFIDPDLGAVSGLTAFGVGETMLGAAGVPAADGSSLFRGIVAVDDVSGEPTPAIARIEIVNGLGWPAGQANDGVPLDDFAFGTPALIEATTTTTISIGPTTTTSTVPCPPVPLADCRRPTVSGASKLRVRNVVSDGRDLLKWSWVDGAATTREEFGDPTRETSYGVCMYSADGLVLAAGIPAGGRCGRKACWKSSRSGYRYRAPDLELHLRAGVEGRAGIAFVARGARLGLPVLPIATPVTLQLVRGAGGLCWDVRYSSAKRNTARQLRTSAD